MATPDYDHIKLLDRWHAVYDAALGDNDPDLAAALADETVAGEALQLALAALPARERTVVELRHGLGGSNRRDLQALSHKLGLSISDLKRIDEQATAKLGQEIKRLTGKPTELATQSA